MQNLARRSNLNGKNESMPRNKSDIPEGFPDRLKILRIKARLSQGELADRVGLHQSNIGRYERGQTVPSADKLKAMADVLGVSTDYLFNGDEESPPSGVAPSSPASGKDLASLLREIDSFPEEEKRVVMDVLDAFVTRRKVREMSGH